ncbi:hypothetical protein S245_001188 [Arachis hypogaea]
MEIRKWNPQTSNGVSLFWAVSAASIAFKKTDPAYSSTLLTRSKSLFDFTDKYRGSYLLSYPFYCSYSGYQV